MSQLLWACRPIYAQRILLEVLHLLICLGCSCDQAPVSRCQVCLLIWTCHCCQPDIYDRFVPNIFNSRPNPASVEAAINRSLNNLRVRKPGMASNANIVSVMVLAG